MKKYIVMFIMIFTLSGCTTVLTNGQDISPASMFIQLGHPDPHSIVSWSGPCDRRSSGRYNQHHRCYYFERHDPRYYYGNCPIVVDRFGRYRLDCRRSIPIYR